MKRGVLGDEERKRLEENLAQLNKTAADCAHAWPGTVHACTDITGFGLLGHMVEMLTPVEGQTPLSAVVCANAVPLLPGARELASDILCVPGGTLNNMMNDKASGVAFDVGVPSELRTLLSDAQSSGGLLFSVPSDGAKELLHNLHEAGLNSSAIIADVRSREDTLTPIIRVA